MEEIIIALKNRGGLKPFLGILAVPHLETLNLSDLKSEDDESIELDNSMRCVVRNFTFTLPLISIHDILSIAELETSSFVGIC